jgi:di/tricarboxylate transporter
MNTGAIIMLLGGGIIGAYLIYDYLQYKMRMRLRRETKDERSQGRMSYDWKVYAMIGVTILVALLYARPITRVIESDTPGVPPTEVTGHAYLVAIYVLIVGIWWSIRQARKVTLSERQLINQQVADLVTAFRSVFRLRPTVFSALEEANRKLDPPVGTAVSHAVTTFYVTSLPQRALDELRQRIQNPYLDQFLYILERGEDAKHEDIMAALDGLLERLRKARELREQSEVNMTVINGQTRIIQLIAIATVLVVGAIPMFRYAYENIPGGILFWIIATVGVGTSWYIDGQANKLKERVL